MAVPQPGPASGYSTQAKISLDIAALINSNHIHLWFASEFHPISNQENSNPLLIFRELDFAGKTGEQTQKSRNVEANLYLWVNHCEQLGRIQRDVRAAATFAVASALGAGTFRPILFRLHDVVAEAKSEPDEYLAENVSLDDRSLCPLIPDRSCRRVTCL